MNSKFKFGITIIGFLIFQTTFSQENFLPGYVIKNNDTIRGLVDYRNWAKNPDRIRFKNTAQSSAIFYEPTDISEFGVKDEIYVGAIVDAEISGTQGGRIDDDPQMNIQVNTTFLQLLIRGDKSLYYYNNEYGRENFYIKQDDNFELLLYKKFLKRRDGKNIIVENNQYLGQLNLYLNDCETIYSKLGDISYNQKSLVKLFKNYYECSSSDISFQKEIEDSNIEFGVLAGVSSTYLEFKSDSFDYLVNADFSTSYNFSTGLFVDIILARNQGKWSIYNELMFTSYKSRGYYEQFNNENYYEITTSEIGNSYLKMNNLVRFKYPVGKLFVFFNGGMSNGYSISETNHKRRELKFYSTDRVVEEPALSSSRRYEQGYLVGTGLNYNRFSAEFRYERGNGMSDMTALNSITRRYHLIFGYRF